MTDKTEGVSALSDVLSALSDRLARWKARRYWTAERQLENLRTMVQGDNQWLAHDPIADAMTTRYLAALAPDWYSKVHASHGDFRREIGLEPASQVAHLKSFNWRSLEEDGDLTGVPGPLPERGWD